MGQFPTGANTRQDPEFVQYGAGPIYEQSLADLVDVPDIDRMALLAALALESAAAGYFAITRLAAVTFLEAIPVWLYTCPVCAKMREELEPILSEFAERVLEGIPPQGEAPIQTIAYPIFLKGAWDQKRAEVNSMLPKLPSGERMAIIHPEFLPPYSLSPTDIPLDKFGFGLTIRAFTFRDS